MSQKVEETSAEKNLFKKADESPQEKLKKFLAENKVAIARTPDELYGPKTGQTQEEIEAEIDDFLRLREEWRGEEHERNTICERRF